jgi:hypothetical protein
VAIVALVGDGTRVVVGGAVVVVMVLLEHRAAVRRKLRLGAWWGPLAPVASCGALLMFNLLPLRLMSIVTIACGLGMAFLLSQMRLLVIVLLNIGVFACLLVIAEGALRSSGRLSKGRVASRLVYDRPLAAYSGAAYWSREFVSEVNARRALRLDERFTYVESREGSVVRNRDVRGTFINYEGGRRRTADQPVSWTKTIWLVGGSTTACEEVPDWATYVSALQRHVSDARIRVENLGHVGASLPSLLPLVRSQTDVRKGDLVIFYWGVNEISGQVDEGDERKWLSSLVDNDLMKFLARYSHVAEMIDRLRFTSSISFSPDQMRATNQEMYLDAQAFLSDSLKQGIDVLFVLQPNAVVDRQPIGNIWMFPTAEWNALVRPNYDMHRKFIGRLGSHGVDASLLFTREPDEIYVDWSHVAHVGNEMIADSLLVTLRLKRFVSDVAVRN